MELNPIDVLGMEEEMSVGFTDHYRVLGVPPAASPGTIRAAYMELAREHHPDVITARGDTQDATGRFAAITASYAVLRDTKKRRVFDAEALMLRKIVVCKACNGVGMLLVGFNNPMERQCKVCGGSGRNEQPAKL